MKHLNNDIMCAIDIETTGKLVGFHDLVEISIVPMIGLRPNKTIMPFNIWLQPKRPENCSKLKNKFIHDCLAHACDPYTAATMFERWYEKLELKHNKRIIPISFAWHNKVGFLIDWLCATDEGHPYYFDFFHELIYRDVLLVANYWNDVAYCISDHIPFTKQRLHFMAQKMGVSWIHPSTTLSRCFTIIETYRKFMELKIQMIDLPFNYPAPIDYELNEENELDEL